MEGPRWVKARFALIGLDGFIEPKFVGQALALIAPPVLNKPLHVSILEINGAPEDLTEGNYKVTLLGNDKALTLGYRHGEWRDSRSVRSRTNSLQGAPTQ